MYSVNNIGLLVPYRSNRVGGRTIGFLSVSLLVVRPLGFPNFSQSSWYWLEIWYMNLSWHNTDQIQLLSHLTYFYMSYCPSLKFCFPNFSLPSFVILTWNLVYEFVLTEYRSFSTFFAFDLLLHEKLPFVKIFCFPNFSLSSLEILTWNLVYEFVLT